MDNGDLNPDYRKTKVKAAQTLIKAYEVNREKERTIQVSEAQQIEVFNHLYAFFSRYYESGDFIPRRRYGARETYAVPYNGEEVFFHWANKDQHYVKTAQNFRDYAFSVETVGGSYRVRFLLTEANLPRMYLDRFVAAKERSAERGHLEPGYLSSVSESLIPYYSIRVSAGELLNQLENLLKKPSELYKNGERPLPRLHVERHLFSPLLLKPEDHKLEGICVRPAGLRKEEADFLVDLQEFWRQHHDDDSYRHKEIYVLRNLPRVGVGFFRRSGFYPDFILWIIDKKDKTTQVQFLDPHGLHHGGLSGNRDKIEALKELKQVSMEEPFKKKKITMTGYLLTRTKREQIPGAENKEWDVLEKDYQILRQEGKEYLKKILKAP